jgi:RHS repeat-associated protein
VVSKSGPGGNYTFGWSYDNRLAGINGAATAGYGYDYQGRRSNKTVSGTGTTYLYDGLNLVWESSTTSAHYLFGPGIDEPIAMSRGGQVSYYATDALGSVNVLTNPFGAVQNSYLYDAWGQTRSQTGSVLNPFMYTSREAGEAATLFYRARYYAPGIGQFLAEDPLRLDPAISSYGYVESDPTDFVDPFGWYKLPRDPRQLPPPWRIDPRHQDPNGSRFRTPDGDVLDFHRGRSDVPGWRGKDHYHFRPNGQGGDEHLTPGQEIPDKCVPQNRPRPQFPFPFVPWGDFLPPILHPCLIYAQLCLGQTPGPVL